jgi:hypothetical protein
MRFVIVMVLLFVVGCAGGGGGGQDAFDIGPRVEIKRVDISYGSCKKGETCDYTAYEYLIGPDQTVYLHQTAGMNLRFIVHFYNEVPVVEQHITITRVDDSDSFHGNHGADLHLIATSDPPLIALTDETTQAWTGGWDVFIGGDLALGEYEFCMWITDTRGVDTPVECRTAISENGWGGLLENVDVEDAFVKSNELHIITHEGD